MKFKTNTEDQNTIFVKRNHFCKKKKERNLDWSGPTCNVQNSLRICHLTLPHRITKPTHTQLNLKTPFSFQPNHLPNKSKRRLTVRNGIMFPCPHTRIPFSPTQSPLATSSFQPRCITKCQPVHSYHPTSQDSSASNPNGRSRFAPKTPLLLSLFP